MKLLFYVFLCLGIIAKAQGQAVVLSGSVFSEDSLPVAGAKVTLKRLMVHTLTDSSGSFWFAGLAPGSYEITCSKESYISRSQNLSISVADYTTMIVLRADQYRLLQPVMIEYNPATIRKKEDAMNVEIITPAFIQRNLGGSLMKTLERLPGIKTIGIGSGQSKPLIRGLGFNRVVVLDRGVKHEGQQWGADHGLEIDQFATGEVHLIKGAASFVYGSDAIAGAIDVVSPPPPPRKVFGGSVDAILKTNNNQYGTSVNVFGRKNKWYFDTRFTYQDYADYRVPTDKVSIYNYEVALFDKRLRNTAGKETGLHLTTGYLGKKLKSNLYVSNTFSNSGFFANAHGLEPRNVDVALHDNSQRDILLPRQEVNHFKIINRNQVEIAGGHLEVDLGYQHNFRQEYNQYVNHGYMPAVYPDTMRIPSTLERQFTKHTFSANLRYRFNIGSHEIVSGLNGEHQQNSINGWSFLVPAFNQLAAGVFIYDKIRISDHFILHAAARYDYSQLDMFSYTDWFPSLNNDTGQKLTRADNLSRNFKSFVYSLGVNYNANEFSVKLNAGKSFRVPIAKELAANGVNYHYFSYERGNPMLDAEQSYQLDAGISWKGERLTVELSPFYNYFPNYIYLNPTAGHDYFYGAGNQVFQYEQSRVQRYGGEFQFNYKSGEFSSQILGEYLQSIQISGSKKGYTIPFSPPPSVLFNLTWSKPDNHKFKNTYLSVDYRIVASQNQIVPPEKKTPGYQLINFQAGSTLQINNKVFILSIQAQNLLDTRYLNHTSFYRLIELPEAGRNIVVSLKVPFIIKRYE